MGKDNKCLKIGQTNKALKNRIYSHKTILYCHYLWILLWCLSSNHKKITVILLKRNALNYIFFLKKKYWYVNDLTLSGLHWVIKIIWLHWLDRIQPWFDKIFLLKYISTWLLNPVSQYSIPSKRSATNLLLNNKYMLHTFIHRAMAAVDGCVDNNWQPMLLSL